ncbi:MAG: helix-turn-helix transcriptional regulator [Lachnotalea sp.]
MNDTILAKRLKELRKAHNYTQEYVASYLNIARQSYSHYETGRNIPSTETLYKLATLYSIRTEDLIQLTMEGKLNTYYDTPVISTTVNELSLFLDYINDSYNEKKLKHLNSKEKELLYYYEKLTLKDQEDILDFIRIKVKKK